MSENADGKYVVVVDGKRANDKLHETEESAKSEADKLRKKLSESQAAPQPKVEIKKNILG